MNSFWSWSREENSYLCRWCEHACCRVLWSL